MKIKKIASVVLSILFICLMFASCEKSKDNPAPKTNELESASSGNVVDNQPIKTDIENDVKIEENAAEKQQISENEICKEAKIFASGKFWIDCVMFTGDNDGLTSTMACDGKNVQADITVEGMSLSIMTMDTKAFLLDTINKNYIELSKSLMSAMGVEDLDLSAITNVSNGGIVQSLENCNKYDVNINGKPGVCIEVTDDEMNTIKYYCTGDKLNQVTLVDKDGVEQMTLTVNSISADIPSDMLTLRGFNQCKTIMSFITGLAGGAME